jgi:hypothetical protein
VEEARIGLMRVCVQVIDRLRFELPRAADEVMDFVALLQVELRQI